MGVCTELSHLLGNLGGGEREQASDCIYLAVRGKCIFQRASTKVERCLQHSVGLCSV